MNNPYRNGKTMSPGLTALAMVYESGVRAALAEVRERWNALDDCLKEEELLATLDGIEAELPPAAPKLGETTDYVVEKA